MTLPDPALRLRTGDGGTLFLRSTIRFEYVAHPVREGERKVSTLYYAHSLATDERLRDELFSWQWHPLETEPSYPHMHVTGGKVQSYALHELHIPTGRVFLESVVAFLIADLGVVPKREEWQAVLTENLARVSRFASWGAADPS